MKPPSRLFDVPTANRLNDLHVHCLEHGYQLFWHFDGLRTPESWHICQAYSGDEKTVITGRDRTLHDASLDLHDQVLKRFPKGLE